MRVAITGSRDWGEDRYSILVSALRKHADEISLVVLGDARGVDALARRACDELGLNYEVHLAQWHIYHAGAGPIRNGKMLDSLHDGSASERRELWWFHDDLANSKGTRNCVRQAEKRGVCVRDGSAI